MNMVLGDIPDAFFSARLSGVVDSEDSSQLC